ncbi:MAG: response regulator transcription factor [Polyangiaceae bacterium]
MALESDSAGIPILVLDDDEPVRRGVGRLLLQEGHTPVLVETIAQAVAAQQEHHAEVALVDWALGPERGDAACAALREQNPAPYIIVMTALDPGSLASESLDSGAMYFMTKPLDSKLLRSRINRLRLLRRESFPPAEPGAGHAPAVFQPDGSVVLFNMTVVTGFTALERRCFAYLVRHRDRVVSARELAREFETTAAAVSNQISKIRKLLGNCRELIETVRGEGFMVRSLPKP